MTRYAGAILIKSLNLSQQGFYIVKSLNALCDQEPNLDTLVFYTEFGRPVELPKFAIMQVEELWSFIGPVIATDLYSANMLLNAPRPTKRYFYLYNLEWLYYKLPYKSYVNVYQNDDMELIARNEHHANIITKCWKEPKYIMENFNNDVLTKIFTESS